MCFLKHVKMVNTPSTHIPSPSKADKNDSDTEMFSHYEMSSIYESKSQESQKVEQQRLLLNCLGLMHLNSALLKNMDDVHNAII